MMKQDGVAVLGYLGGYRSSSTRIELVGVILSIMSDLPVFLACDSQSVVNRAQLYANHLRTNATDQPPGKPFLLLKNGDLWSIFYNILKARGPHTFHIKKTKGHALANVDYLKRFPHLRGEARNNNEADLLADKARFNFYNSYHIELSQLLAKRQDGTLHL